MPGFDFPGWPAREPDEPLLDLILAGQSLPPDAPQAMAAVADALAALGGPAGPGELPGEMAALSAFSRAISPAARIRPASESARRGRPSRRARLAAGFIMVLFGVGGTTAAAYAGVLPAPVQAVAHRLIGAPAAQHHGNGGPPGGRAHAHRPAVAPPPAPQEQQHSRACASKGHRAHHRPAHPAHPCHPNHPGHPPNPAPGEYPGKSRH
jgi:hypothetical protein